MKELKKQLFNKISFLFEKEDIIKKLNAEASKLTKRAYNLEEIKDLVIDEICFIYIYEEIKNNLGG